MSENELKIVARPKGVDGQKEEPRVVILKASNLEELFVQPLHVAAKNLGLSSTSLKR